MEIEEMRNEWQGIETPQVELYQFKNMTMEKCHPLLIDIRKQLTIELLGWVAFLVICFTGLDADQKPLITNAILLLSVALSISLNVYGYQLSKKIIMGLDIKTSLKKRINALKRFAILSVLFRIILISGVGNFLTSSINFNQNKILSLTVGAVLCIFSLYLLSRVWANRIGKLSGTLKLLETEN